MSTFLHYYFAEPGAPWWRAAIWGNIFASLLWGFAAGFVGYLVAKRVKAAWGHLHRKLTANHEAHQAALLGLHRRIDSHAHANAQHVKALKAHEAKLDELIAAQKPKRPLPKPSHSETSH